MPPCVCRILTGASLLSALACGVDAVHEPEPLMLADGADPTSNSDPAPGADPTSSSDPVPGADPTSSSDPVPGEVCAPSCSESANRGRIARGDLGCYCNGELAARGVGVHCPESPCAAAADLYPAENISIATGCGMDSVAIWSMYEERRYYFSSDTHALLGVHRLYDSRGGGPCREGEYEIGTLRGACEGELPLELSCP